MGGKITKTEKILLLCTAVFVLALGALCLRDMTAERDAGPTLTVEREASPDELIPPEARLVNINTAPAERLMELPGIGATLAERIVEYRESHGPFRETAELLNVKGVGQSTWQQLMDEITVEEETP